MSLVVDASVAIKWFLPEVHSQAARRILKKPQNLLAPDLIWPEVGNTIWKKFHRNEIDADEAAEIIRDFIRLPLEIHDSKLLLELAWTLARYSDGSVYDSLYVALSLLKKSPLVTADRKLYDRFGLKFKGYSVEPRLIWVEDIK